MRLPLFLAFLVSYSSGIMARTAMPQFCDITVYKILHLHRNAYAKAGFKIISSSQNKKKGWLTVSYQNTLYPGFKHNIGYRFEPTDGTCMTAAGYVVEKEPKSYLPTTKRNFLAVAYESDKRAYEEISKELEGHRRFRGSTKVLGNNPNLEQ